MQNFFMHKAEWSYVIWGKMDAVGHSHMRWLMPVLKKKYVFSFWSLRHRKPLCSDDGKADEIVLGTEGTKVRTKVWERVWEGKGWEECAKAHAILLQKWPSENLKEPNQIKRKGHVYREGNITSQFCFVSVCLFGFVLLRQDFSV